MSEFLFIIPPGWKRVPDEVVNVIGQSYFEPWIRECNFTVIGEVLREHWVDAPEGVNQAMYFNGEILIVK